MSDLREVFIVTYRPWGEDIGYVSAAFSKEDDARRYAAQAARREVIIVPVDSRLEYSQEVS